MASCSMMLFAWSSVRHVDFTAVQAPLAENSAPAAALAEKSALASAIGSKGMSIILNRIMVFSYFTDVDLHNSGS